MEPQGEQRRRGLPYMEFRKPDVKPFGGPPSVHRKRLVYFTLVMLVFRCMKAQIACSINFEVYQ